MAVQDWSEDPDQNGLVLGIDIAEDCPAANINNGLRITLAQIATWVKGAIFTGITKIKDAAGDTGSAVLRFTNNADTVTLGFIQSLIGGGLAFGNASTERMRITPDGRLGVGTSSPAHPLDVVGTARATAVAFTSSNASLTANSGRSSFNVDVGDTYSFDRVNNLHEFFIGDVRQGYVDGAGRIVANTELVATTLVRCGGFTNFFMNYNGGNPYVNFGNNSYNLFDAVNGNFSWVINGQVRAVLSAGGIFNAVGGIQVNGSGVDPVVAQNLTNNGYRRYGSGYTEFWGFTTVPANTTAMRVNYPVALASWSNAILSGGAVNPLETENNPFAYNSDTGGFYINNSLNGPVGVWWQAKGV